MENSSKESKVKYIRKKQEMHYYRIIVDKKFIEANKLRRKCEISVIPNNVYWTPNADCEQYTVYFLIWLDLFFGYPRY